MHGLMREGRREPVLYSTLRAAGASAPEVLVQEVEAHLQVFGAGIVEELQGVVEGVEFPIPKDLVSVRS